MQVREQADRVDSSQHFVEHVYSSLFSESELFTKQLVAGVMLEGFACTVLLLSVQSISSMYAVSVLSSWTMELLAFASRQFTPKTIDLSIRFIRSHIVQSFLVNERTGRPRIEAPCTFFFLSFFLSRLH